ncbi:hypothetical protein [Aurantiacibacter zhengii]|uniref:hypothetical protein n=1 Tax=Aurantiacibacter zhengii TaxID=2307003 RepID=UPI0011C225B8|nr:hypothetical protein [Aurantiacibacter zhengii]
MTAQLMVKSTLIDPNARDAFDQWYGEDHLPQAARAFSPSRCWRAWSDQDPTIHYAFYEFAEPSQIADMMASRTFADLVDDFSQKWDGKVIRVRDVTTRVQLIDASPS